MPINDPFELTENSEVRLEPVLNILQSMLLLVYAEKTHGYDPWIYSTRSAMDEERYHMHKLVIYGCHYILFPERKFTDFAEYLLFMKQEPPEQMCERMLWKYWSMNALSPGFDNYDPAFFLSSGDVYLKFLRSRFTADFIDDELETEVYSLILDLEKMKEMIISHIEYMWDGFFRDQWVEHELYLSKVVRSIDTSAFRDMSRIETARYITGQEFREQKWVDLFESADSPIFIPSMHLGITCAKMHLDRLYVFFGAGVPSGLVDKTGLNRAEFAVRMSALGDSTRLNILDAVREHESLSSKEIMELLQLSQSAGSRHLKLLSAVGFLNETRFEGGKRYSLNSIKFRHTAEQLTGVFGSVKQEQIV